MAGAIVSETEGLTLDDLLERFGPIPAYRIRSTPPPGTATEADWLQIEACDDRLYELVDGVLLQKAWGYFESRLAAVLTSLLEPFTDANNLGIVVGSDAASKLLPGLIRIPDVSFVSWDRLPDGKTPREPLPDLVPDLAVEVLSKGNTAREMERKLHDYFDAGVRLVWYVDPPRSGKARAGNARVYTSPQDCEAIEADGTLKGGDVLPGFELKLSDWFAKVDRPERKPSKKRRGQ